MRRIAAVLGLAMMVVGACGGTSRSDRFAAPAELDGGTMVKVDRTAENELAATMVTALEDLGYPEAISGVYEFEIVPDKPVFFLGVGRGRAGDERVLLDQALALLGGGNGTTAPPAEMTSAGGTYLCAPYSHTGVLGTTGTGGLASMSAVCSWADEDGGGYGVWVAGAGVEDTLDRTAEAREAVG